MTTHFSYDIHLKGIQQIDTKLKSETIEKVNKLEGQDNDQSNMLFSSDAAGNISILYDSHFPVASFNLRDLVPNLQ